MSTTLGPEILRIDEAKRRSIKGAATDEDKIINPG